MFLGIHLRGLDAAGLLAAVAACTTTGPSTVPRPSPTPGGQPSGGLERGITPNPAPPLPAIPLVEGKVAPKVVYPSANASIPVRDSNFIFGSVGNGHATLTINGANVPVAPNGTFLAYLPVPPPTAPRYELVATAGADNARLTVPVRVPPPRPDLSASGRLVVDSGSVAPRGVTLALRDPEPVRVSIRAPANANVWVAYDGGSRPLANIGGTQFATDLPARYLRLPATLFVARGADTARFPLAKVAIADTSATAPSWVQLGDMAAMADTDAAVIGRDIPQGTYKWMLLPGTIVQQTGRSGDNIRVRLDSALEVWTDSVNVKPLPANYPAPRRAIGPITLTPAAEWVDIAMPVSSPPPFLLEQERGRLTLTLYGATATPEVIKFLGNDSLVRFINWIPETSDRLRLSMELSAPPYGYLVFYEPARGMVLRLRRAPRIDVRRPLQGLTITVDPGHPPGGAIGPTAFTEAEGVLQVSMILKRILEERGARVVMTRTTMDAVDLHERSVIARRANSHALISIHENAFGDGVNPFPNVGTSTLFFHPQTEPLARLVQAGMMREMGLRDLGVHYQNIAIGRTTWMPSLITEGLFLMVPEQENAAKTPSFQERYARGVADGVEAYFRSLAR